MLVYESCSSHQRHRARPNRSFQWEPRARTAGKRRLEEARRVLGACDIRFTGGVSQEEGVMLTPALGSAGPF